MAALLSFFAKFPEYKSKDLKLQNLMVTAGIKCEVGDIRVYNEQKSVHHLNLMGDATDYVFSKATKNSYKATIL